jgi:hypothetical protein
MSIQNGVTNFLLSNHASSSTILDYLSLTRHSQHASFVYII